MNADEDVQSLEVSKEAEATKNAKLDDQAPKKRHLVVSCFINSGLGDESTQCLHCQIKI